MNRKVFLFLGVLVAIGGFLTYLAAFYPGIFSIIINFLWILMLLVVAIFLVLGALVIFGLKKEVSEFLDILLEGSLTIIDAFQFLKELYEKFILVLKDFIYFVTPIIAVWLAFFLYLGVLFLYKEVGRENDVTLLTTVITVVSVAAVGILNRPKKEAGSAEYTWFMQVKDRFQTTFSDSFEIVIFIFFLTMDSTNLFFLPDRLNVPLTAEIGNYDLMLRGVNVSSQLRVTVMLVALSIIIEIIRNIIRLVAVSLDYYKQLPKDDTSAARIKKSIRLSFNDAKDDLIKFITYTTVLILVFLVFPRLKLFAMFVTTITALILDFIIPARIRTKRGNDLISRIITKAFNV